jgi:hypothetical protein
MGHPSPDYCLLNGSRQQSAEALQIVTSKGLVRRCEYCMFFTQTAKRGLRWPANLEQEIWRTAQCNCVSVVGETHTLGL